jgi:hypothetical protein
MYKSHLERKLFNSVRLPSNGGGDLIFIKSFLSDDDDACPDPDAIISARSFPFPDEKRGVGGAKRVAISGGFGLVTGGEASVRAAII